MNRNISKLAPYLQSVIYLRKDTQKEHLAALARIFKRTEQELLDELLKAVLQPHPKAKKARLSPDEMKSLRCLLRGLTTLPEESLHALADEMEKETKRPPS
ncbi:MAG TPA: hypothetical protein VFA18_20645 [Gemmataceae bacterium]|nr:hypothetical protein [Gemmataceae bacterium]